MEVMHHEEMPMVKAEPLKCGFDRRHVHCHTRCILASNVLRAVQGDQTGAASAPEHIAASIHDCLVQPRIELRVVAELGKVAPGRDERLLDDVVGIGLAAEDRGGSSKGSAEPSRYQRLEGTNVATGCPFDEGPVANSCYLDPLRHVHTIRTKPPWLALGRQRRRPRTISA